MRWTGLFFVAALIAGTSAAFAGGQMAEGKLQMKDLPPAVKATVEAETKGATLKGLSKEKDKGKTVYEVETLVNGHSRDLMVDSAGKVYEVEEQLDVDKAPAPVKAAMEAKGKILTLESVQRGGKTTYEGTVRTRAGKKASVAVGADGKPITP
jgi:uncharacterized membrane protein YkoI